MLANLIVNFRSACAEGNLNLVKKYRDYINSIDYAIESKLVYDVVYEGISLAVLRGHTEIIQVLSFYNENILTELFAEALGLNFYNVLDILTKKDENENFLVPQIKDVIKQHIVVIYNNLSQSIKVNNDTVLDFFLSRPEYYRAVVYNDNALFRLSVFTNKKKTVEKFLQNNCLRSLIEHSQKRYLDYYNSQFPLYPVNNLNPQEEYSTIHFIWCGKPEGDSNIISAIRGPLLIDRLVSDRQKIYYWCDSRYINYIMDLFEKYNNQHRINFLSYTDLFNHDLKKIPLFKNTENLLKINSIFNILLTNKKFNYCKAILSPIVLYLYGGYYLDTTILPTVNSKFYLPAYHENLFVRNVDHPSFVSGLKLDVWASYAPAPRSEVFEKIIVIQFLIYNFVVLKIFASYIDYLNFAEKCQISGSKEIDSYYIYRILQDYQRIIKTSHDPLILILYATAILLGRLYISNYQKLLNISPVAYNNESEIYERNPGFQYCNKRKVNFLYGVFGSDGFEKKITRRIIGPDGYQLPLVKEFGMSVGV